MKKTRINSFRVASASVIICAVMGLMLSLQTGKLQNILLKISEKGELENLEWLFEYASYCLPVIIVAIVLTAFYSIFKAEDATVMHKEKTIASVVLTIFTFAILLPIVASKKEPLEEGGKTLIEMTAVWFAFQAVPMLVMMLYHTAMNDGSEKVIDTGEKASEEKEEQ